MRVRVGNALARMQGGGLAHLCISRAGNLALEALRVAGSSSILTHARAPPPRVFMRLCAPPAQMTHIDEEHIPLKPAPMVSTGNRAPSKQPSR